MIMKQKDLSSKKEAKFNDFKVSPIWAVVTIVFTLAILINSGIIIYYSRLFTIQSEQNKYLKEDLKIKEKIYSSGLVVSNDDYADSFLRGVLSDYQLRTLSKTFWSYEFYVNDKKIITSDIIVSKDSAVFTLKQIEKERILPINLHILGSLTAGDKADRFYEHPMFNSNSNYITTPPLAGNNPAIATYEFKEAKAGDTITITLTPPLQERLGLTEPQIRVKVK